MFERKILRKIYGPVKDQGNWRIRTNSELDTLIGGVVVLQKKKKKEEEEKEEEKKKKNRVIFYYPIRNS